MRSVDDAGAARAPGTTRGPWFCYLVACADATLYAGITTDLERRVREHNRGVASKYTRSRLPVRLVYAETQPDRASASRRERQIKSMGLAAKRSLVAACPAPVGSRSGPDNG